MKLFRCHAVLPRAGDDPARVVTTYAVVARTWQAARVLVRAEAIDAEFVTVPVEIDDVWMVGVRSITEHEFAQLRSACEWNASQLDADAPPASRDATKD